MINKISNDPVVQKIPQKKYEMTIKDLETNEIIYQNEGFAGLICFMEKVKHFGAMVEGDHQQVAWGNPVLQVYCFDQLEKWFKKEGLIRALEELKAQGFIKSNVDFRDFFKQPKK